jgi:hypothetical protein
MRKYFRNFGNMYAERREVNVVGEPPRGMSPVEYYYLLEEKVYKGVPYKNKYLYFIEFWIIGIFMFSPFWLGYLLKDYIYPIVIGTFKILITALLWLYRL